jgi:putative phosphoesterase
VRVAALYDIHANLPALQAVLDEVRALNVNQLVIGGDVLPGPMPRETLEHLETVEIPMRFLRGNGESAVLQPEIAPERFRAEIRWNAEQLDGGAKKWIASWPLTVQIDIPGMGSVLFCHATPQNENDIFTRLTPVHKLLPVFDGLDVAIVVCGHTHMQFDRTLGNVRVVNAGSVGMPFGSPGADWLLISDRIELRRTQYDLATAAERVRTTRYPGAEQFAAKNLLQPPGEQEMLELFTRAELK